MPDEIDLNDEEEAALSRAWARLAKAPRAPDVPFAVTGPDLSGLGDLLNLSRQEVLDALFDAAIDSFDLALPDASFNVPSDFVQQIRPEGPAAFGAPDQPRLPAGQAGGGEWTSGGGGAGGDRAARKAYARRTAELEAAVERAERVHDRVTEAASRRLFAWTPEADPPEDPRLLAVQQDLARAGDVASAGAMLAPDGQQAAFRKALKAASAAAATLKLWGAESGSLAAHEVKETLADAVSLQKLVQAAARKTAASWQAVLDATAALEAHQGDAPFYSPDQPRDELGRWTSGGGGVPAELASLADLARAHDTPEAFAAAVQAGAAIRPDEAVKAAGLPVYGWVTGEGHVGGKTPAWAVTLPNGERSLIPKSEAEHLHGVHDLHAFHAAARNARVGRTPAEHAARRQAAADAVRAFARGQGPPTREEAEALAGHLAKLTVSQIHALKAEHGLKGSAPNKAALVQKLAGRFRAHRAANPVAPPPPAPAPAAKTPVPKEPPVPPAPAKAKPPRPPSPAPPAPPAADAAPGAPWLPADRVRAMDPREERDLRDFTRSTLAPALTGPETRAIDAYTGDDFTKINAAARGESDDPRLRRSVNAIDRVLRKAPLLPRPVYAYRGINVQPDVAERLTREFEEAARTGGTVTLRGFQSTSLTPGLAHGFATTISARKGGVPLHFEIRAREGMYVDPLSDMGGENELLLPRDRQYRVVGVSESVPVRGVSKPVRYVQLEQVWDQTKPTASSALKPISSSTEVLASAKSLRDLTASETIHRLADAEGTPPPAEVEGRVRTLAAGMTSEQLRAELGIPRGGKDALIRKAAGQILERVGSLRRSRI